ncbi:MAG: acetoacetate decarboxylase family protein [Candidatus Binatia bacterium]
MNATRARPAPAQVYEIQGRRVTLPATVRDASAGNAMFMVPAVVAQRLVGNAFDVIELAPNQAQLILGFVDYRDNDLGNYNEAMIVFMVRPRGSSAGDGTFIYKLPVDQSFTCEAGRRIWGFPKSVGVIDIDYASDRATCRLVMDGQHVFTLSVPRRTVEMGDGRDTEMTTYTYLDGAAAVPFTTGGGTAVVSAPEGVELHLGAHPLADELRTLGLPAPPLMSMWTEHMHGFFSAPRKL